jgi:Cu/Ag efflux pump CusA
MNEMRWIVATSLRFRYLVVFVATVLIIFGIAQIRSLPVDVFPEFAPPRVEVQTPSLGLSSEEVEALVTIPLEQVFKGCRGLMSCDPSRWSSCRPFFSSLSAEPT